MSDVYIKDAFINRPFVERVERVVDGSLLKDESWKYWKKLDKKTLEDMNLSELERRFENFNKYDFAAAVLVAMENYPFMVLQIVAEYVERRGKNE